MKSIWSTAIISSREIQVRLFHCGREQETNAFISCRAEDMLLSIDKTFNLGSHHQLPFVVVDLTLFPCFRWARTILPWCHPHLLSNKLRHPNQCLHHHSHSHLLNQANQLLSQTQMWALVQLHHPAAFFPVHLHNHLRAQQLHEHLRTLASHPQVL